MAAPVHRGVSIEDFPDVLLAGILDFSGLGEIAACAAASAELRDGLKRLSPGLERRLVFRRFPMLEMIGDDTNEEEPPPRELFLSQTRLFAERPRFAPLSRSIDDYVFCAELELLSSRRSDQGAVITARESIFVDTGGAYGGPRAEIHFYIPGGLLDRAFQFSLGDDDDSAFVHEVHLRLMASRGYSRARLGQGVADEYERDRRIEFYNLGIGGAALQHGPPQASDWLVDIGDMYNKLPSIEAIWEPLDEDDIMYWPRPEPGASGLTVNFRWSDNFHNADMSGEEVVQALERYATWT